MAETLLHSLLTKAEEALLARTLTGRRLARDVIDAEGRVLYAAGTEIDHALLDHARERQLLEEVAHAAEPSTSDTELAEFLWWRKHRRDEAGHRHGDDPHRG